MSAADTGNESKPDGFPAGCLLWIAGFAILAFYGWASGGWERGYRAQEQRNRDRYTRDMQKLQELDTKIHARDSNARPAYPRIRPDDAVRGHYRADGTYVAPYYRTPRNSTEQDNYSSRNRLNPYTGDRGSKLPSR